MDVFTSLTGLLIATGAVVAVGVAMASAFGLGGLGLWSRRKRNQTQDL